MAQSEERFSDENIEVVVSYDSEGHWTWKITILKNGEELDQLRSADVPGYILVGDLFRYNGVSGLSSQAMDLVHQIKKRVPPNELLGY